MAKEVVKIEERIGRIVPQTTEMNTQQNEGLTIPLLKKKALTIYPTIIQKYH